MTADRSYLEQNAVELARLRSLLRGLSDDQLSTPMDAGWTLSAVLVHMAFWDYRIVAQVERWGPDGRGTPPHYSEAAIDWINDANKPIFLAIPSRVAATIVVDAAEAADRAVGQLSDELLAATEAMGWIINPMRAEHRGEHLDEIERLFPSR